MDISIHIPDIVFLILGIACLMVLISIKRDLSKISRQIRKTADTWSFEEQLKLRAKYLRENRHLKEYLDNQKSTAPVNLN